MFVCVGVRFYRRDNEYVKLRDKDDRCSECWGGMCVFMIVSVNVRVSVVSFCGGGALTVCIFKRIEYVFIDTIISCIYCKKLQL